MPHAHLGAEPLLHRFMPEISWAKRARRRPAPFTQVRVTSSIPGEAGAGIDE